MTRPSARLTPALLCLLGGCVSTGSADCGGPTSELGNGTFSHECADGDDAACDAPQFFTVEPIAVGARFKLDFTPSQPGNAIALESVSPERIAELPSASALDPVFEAKLAGTAAIRAVRDGRVVDVVHRELEPIADVRVSLFDATFETVTELALEPGAERALLATPHAAEGEQLAGSLASSWTLEDSSVASLSSGEGNDVVLTAVAPGSTTLIVQVGDVTETVPVTVADPSEGGGGSVGGGGAGEGGGGSGGQGGGA